MRQPRHDLPSYPQLIASCRKAAGLSLAEFAEKARVTPATIKLWESPSYEGIDLSILQRVARATGTSLAVEFRGAEATRSPVASRPAQLLPNVPPAPRAGRAAPGKRRARAWLELLDGTVA